MGGSVRALVREAGRIARMDGQRPFAGRAPGTARVNPDPFSDVKTDLMVDFALGEEFSAHAEKGGVPPSGSSRAACLDERLQAVPKG